MAENNPQSTTAPAGTGGVSHTGAPRDSATSTTQAGGTTVIVNDVIAKVASLAVRDVPGVYALGGGMERAFGAIRNVVGNSDHGQGVSVEVGETEVAADVTFVADYPVPLQKVANDVRAAVYHIIENLVGMHVSEVNVSIIDVHVPGEDEAAGDNQDRAAGARVS